MPGSPFGRAVLIALEEKGARYQLRPVAPGTLRLPEHLSLHPFGRVPVLEHGGFRLYETGAILRYLERILPAPALIPPDPHQAARMDQLMNINDWYLFQGPGMVIGFQRVVGPRLMGIAPDEAAIEAVLPKAHAVFAELSALLGRQAYLAGDAFTLADALVAPQMDFLSMAPEWQALTVQRSNLVEWLARVNARPSLRATTWERQTELARAA
ncbi:MAG: glutathione S-transferase family protein [Proteobacteria bacterium]|nr:glutathione S-transferase family protein [Pseudomonadota bacterium]